MKENEGEWVGASALTNAVRDTYREIRNSHTCLFKLAASTRGSMSNVAREQQQLLVVVVIVYILPLKVLLKHVTSKLHAPFP
jgi:hypothetical protein